MNIQKQQQLNKQTIENFRDIHQRLEYRDGELFWKEPHKFSHFKPGEPAGWFDKEGRNRVIINKQHFYRSHLVWVLNQGKWPNVFRHIDHINEDCSDDRIENLQEISHNENTRRSAYRRSKPVLTQRECPHCGKIGKGSNMTRYHFDNCKHY